MLQAPHRYRSLHAIWDHTELPATRQRQHSRPYLGSDRSFWRCSSQPISWLVLRSLRRCSSRLIVYVGINIKNWQASINLNQRHRNIMGRYRAFALSSVRQVGRPFILPYQCWLMIPGRPKGGRRRMKMLHMSAKHGYVALKWEAEDRWRWSHRTSCHKPAV